jgi:H+/gluconate symporter-like permease
MRINSAFVAATVIAIAAGSATVAVIGFSRDTLPLFYKAIRHYELKAAIHNHGPDKTIPIAAGGL